MTSMPGLLEGQPLGRLALKVPGLHNVYNALAAVAVGMDLDLSFEVIRDALADFTGVDRRFQCRGEAGGITVVDDYAHHPVELKATLNAAKDGFGRRVIAVFQPHRYSRTQALLGEFSTRVLPGGPAVRDGDLSGRRGPDPGGERPADRPTVAGHGTGTSLMWRTRASWRRPSSTRWSPPWC